MRNVSFCIMTSYIKLLMEQINVLWEEFLLLEDTVSVMIEDADEQEVVSN